MEDVDSACHFTEALWTQAIVLVSVEKKNLKGLLKQRWDQPTSDIYKCSASAKKYLSKENGNHSSWNNYCHSLLSSTSRNIVVRHMLNCWTNEFAENALHKK